MFVTEWDDNTEGYTSGYENKTGTRAQGLTRVLYSKTQCYKSGFSLSFRILDSGEKSPIDGLGLAVTNEDIDTLKREGAVFLGCDGQWFYQTLKQYLKMLFRLLMTLYNIRSNTTCAFYPNDFLMNNSHSMIPL